MLMSRRSAVLTFVGCFLAVVAFQWLGLAWSFADVHPGGDVAADRNRVSNPSRCGAD